MSFMYLGNQKQAQPPLEITTLQMSRAHMIIPVLDIQVPEGGQSIRINYFCAIVEAFFESNIVGAYLARYVLLFLVFVLFVPTSQSNLSMSKSIFSKK